MTEKDKQPEVSVSPSHRDVAALVASFGQDPEFMRQLEQAAVLIIPSDLGPEHEGPVFPNTTRNIFRQLREGLSGLGTVDSPVRDEDYVEFSFHSEMDILPVIFIAQNIVIPTLVNLLAAFLSTRLSRRKEQIDRQVTAEFHIKNQDGNIVSLKYTGPVETFERLTMQAFRDLKVVPNEEQEERNDGSS